MNQPSDFTRDVIDIIQRYYITDTDQDGQIVIYTGCRFDDNENIIEDEF